MRELKQNIACAMTVAGSDSGGGAGIQADLLAMAANDVYACSAIAALTAQNPDGVRMIRATDAQMLTSQMEAIADFYKPSAAKTGMLFNAQIVNAVADFFVKQPQIKVVCDPVMIATSGAKLLQDDAVNALKTRLLPLATLITPNLDEAAYLLGTEKISDLKNAALELVKMFSTNILLKGGHLAGRELLDVLAYKNGDIFEIHSTRIMSVNTHGSGCTLSAAIAANLAKGQNLLDSCKNAHAYLLAGMRKSVKVGGQKFINHFPIV